MSNPTQIMTIKVRQHPLGKVPKKAAVQCLRISRFTYWIAVRKLLSESEQFREKYTSESQGAWSISTEAFELLAKSILGDTPYQIQYE